MSFYSFIIHGNHNPSKARALVDDNNWQIPTEELWDTGVVDKGYSAAALFVTVEVNDARVGFGGADAASGAGHVFAAGDSFRITGYANIAAMKIANAAAGSNTKIIYTVEF